MAQQLLLQRVLLPRLLYILVRRIISWRVLQQLRVERIRAGQLLRLFAPTILSIVYPVGPALEVAQLIAMVELKPARWSFLQRPPMVV